MKVTDHKLVMVNWRDAESHDTWISVKDATSDDTDEVASVGWLLADRPDKLILIASISLREDGQVSGHLAIPKAMVTSIKELAIKKPRQPKKVPVEQAT